MTRVLVATGGAAGIEEAVSALRRDEVEVVRADSGVDALQRLATERVDCVVSSARLSDMGGIQFLRRVHDAHPAVPTVLLVGSGNMDLLNRAAAVGVDDVLTTQSGSLGDLVSAVRDDVIDRQLATTRDRDARVYQAVSRLAMEAVTASLDGEVERTVCTELADSSLYAMAWLSSYDPEADRLVPERAAGIDVGHLGPRDRSGELTWDGGAVVEEAPGGSATEIAVPLGYEGSLFAVLHLTTTREVDRTERAALSELGTTLGALLHGEDLSVDIHPQVEEFSTIVAHELRNQLSLAYGYLERAREGELTDWGRFETVLDRIEQIADETATIASGQVDPEDLEPIELAELAGTAWDHVGQTAEDARLRVEDSTTVYMHPALLQHAFENFFQNSITHAGGFFRGGDGPADDLEVRVGTLEDGFYIEDTGRGIPEGDRERVFQWGYTTHPEGDGVGLPLIKRFIDAHGWDVTVTESAEGGARFEIRFEDGAA